MAIVNCPECSKKLKVADTSVGKKVKCTCGTIFVAPAAEASAPPIGVAEKVLVACTECAAKLKVAAASLGKKMKCPKCTGIFVAALPATAMAEDTMIPPRQPAPDEDEVLHFADAESREDEEDLPKPKAKSRTRQEDEDEDAPAPKPVYPSRLLVNLFVLFLVLAYGAFFALTHPDVKVLDLGLVKPQAMRTMPLRDANQPGRKKDGKLPAPFPRQKGMEQKS